jgi:hypothetical protein
MKAPKSEGGNFEKHPEGAYAIVCTRVIDLGTVWNEAKQKDEHKLMIGFESSEKMTSEEHKGKPFMVFANFNFSMYQNSHLCKFIEDWRGRKFKDQEEADDFDFSNVLEKPAFANIVHNGKYVNVQSIMPVPKGVAPIYPAGDLILFDFANRKDFDKLSDNMKERIKKAKEWTSGSNEPPAGHPANESFDDDIPF